MENKTSTTKFMLLNSNLKRIVFSFLETKDQRVIYFLNKKFKNLLTDSAVKININTFKKRLSYDLNEEALNLIELSEGKIACWTKQGIILLKYNKDGFNLIKKLPFESIDNISPILSNQNVIFSFCSELKIFDGEFNLIQSFKESSNTNGDNTIYSLCNISETSFATGLADGTLKIYTRIYDSQKYDFKKYKLDGLTHVMSLTYLPKFNVLALGLFHGKIKIFSLSKGKIIQHIRGHTQCVSCLIPIDDITFASSSRNGQIKIWSKLESLYCFKLIKMIKACSKSKFANLYIHLLANDLLVAKSEDIEHDKSFYKYKSIKIFDLKPKYGPYFKENYPIKVLNEDYTKKIDKVLVSSNNNIITFTNKTINIWKTIV